MNHHPSQETYRELQLRAADNRPLANGGIILAATPLGNPLDASLRLMDALASADIIAAEDTRRTRALADALGVQITGQVVSNFDHNEQDKAGWLVEQAGMGKRVLVVTDAGMPAVSDPGFPVVLAAHNAGVSVTCLPGPSAVPTALALSGVGMGHFTFLGFAPRKNGARRTFFEGFAAGKPDSSRAVCFFESPHRLADTLAIAAEVLGDRMAAVCRELTKTYEEVRRAPLPELAEWAQEGVKGEICVIIGAVDQDTAPAVDVADLVHMVEDKVAAGQRMKDASAEVAQRFGVNKKELYNATVAAKG